MHNPDSKVHGTNMGPIWGRQDPGGPHVGPVNFAIWEHFRGAVWWKSKEEELSFMVAILEPFLAQSASGDVPHLTQIDLTYSNWINDFRIIDLKQLLPLLQTLCHLTARKFIESMIKRKRSHVNVCLCVCVCLSVCVSQHRYLYVYCVFYDIINSTFIYQIPF